MLKFLSGTGAIALAACFALAAAVPASAAEFPHGGGMGGMHMGGGMGGMHTGGMGGPMHMGGMGAPMHMGGMGAPMRMGGMHGPAMVAPGARGPAFVPRGAAFRPNSHWAGGWGHDGNWHRNAHWGGGWGGGCGWGGCGWGGCGWGGCGDDYFYPAAGFLAGTIVGGALANDYYYQPAYANAHVTWCYNRYRTYRVADNTFQPNYGPRAQCISPYDR